VTQELAISSDFGNLTEQFQGSLPVFNATEGLLAPTQQLAGSSGLVPSADFHETGSLLHSDPFTPGPNSAQDGSRSNWVLPVSIGIPVIVIAALAVVVALLVRSRPAKRKANDIEAELAYEAEDQPALTGMYLTSVNPCLDDEASDQFDADFD
jgi:hypothetical protein